MVLINSKNKYHLYYLFVNDIRDDWYNGLSHVAEHALLIPTDIGMQFNGRGYTCTSHVCLYFGSDNLETLQEVDKKIMSGSIVTDENVRYAKEQVIAEILHLQDKTRKYEEMVSFITEHRIKKSVIGDPLDISNIQTSDVMKWFEEKKLCSRIYRFLFREAKNMLLSTPIPQLYVTPRLSGKECRNCLPFDSFLYTVPPAEVKTIQIYYNLPSVYLKKDIINKALYEFCIQRKIQDSMGIDINITDRFFSVEERFGLLEFQRSNISEIDNIIRRIRLEINTISSEEFRIYTKEFRDYIREVMNRNETNYEVINMIKNKIVYSVPQIQLEDVNDIIWTEQETFPKERITSLPLKIVML